MNADQINKLRVVEVTLGTDIGRVSGLLIDIRERRVAAIAVTTGHSFGGPGAYVPWGSIVSIGHDVITIRSPEAVIRRKSFSTQGMLDSLVGKKVVTDDGVELGTVRSFSIDPVTGDIAGVMFGRSGGMLAGVFGTGKEYQAPATLIEALGDNIVVDKSLPKLVGYDQAA